MKLSIELVPATCWFSNVRSAVSKVQWDKIRRQVYKAAGHVCQVCGGVGPRHPVECHEIWAYDDAKQIQKLVDMIALCPDCHQVKHFGFARSQGKGELAMQHLMSINGLTKKQAELYLHDAMVQWFERSQKQWTLDISCLVEYGIDTNEIKR